MMLAVKERGDLGRLREGIFEFVSGADAKSPAN